MGVALHFDELSCEFHARINLLKSFPLLSY
jgi:hypothetical protein